MLGSQVQKRLGQTARHEDMFGPTKKLLGRWLGGL